MENTIQAAAVIIGIVNGIKMAWEQDKKGFILFVCAVATGLGLGFMRWYGLTPELGLATALGSSGLYVVAKRFGGQ